MTTARERYEAKTRVVTFRVQNEMYNELKTLKAKSGLSFTDLIKLGAGIDRDKIEAKIDQASGMRGQIESLERAAQIEKQKLKDIMTRERQDQLDNLAKEIQVYRLFGLGWSKQEIKFKFRMSAVEVSQRFKDWCAINGDEEKIKVENLKKCLKYHIDILQQQIYFRAWGKTAEEMKRQLAHYRHMLTDPSKMTQEEKDWLIERYS